jgi:hypothetical protein
LFDENHDKKLKLIQNLFENEFEKTKKLYEYADKTLKLFSSGKSTCRTGADIINDIVEKLINGNRSWNINEYPDAYMQIKYLVKSETSNFMLKEFRMINVNDFENEDNEESDSINYNNIADLKLSEILLREENTELIKIFDNEISKFDDDINLVYLGIKNGQQNQEIAKDLGLSVNDVENIKKRIRRILNKAFLHYKNN